MRERVLIIDDDAAMLEALRQKLNPAGVLVEAAADGFSAIEKLRDEDYSAVVLDPMIRHRLNGFAVLNFIELERPEIIEHLFLLTAMSTQTIARTAPAVRDRLFRKPADASRIADAILAMSRRPATGIRAMSVLIVEDDALTAQTMGALVETLGFDVVVARSGREALACLTNGDDYVAIMLDLVLPDLDGFAVLEHLRNAKPDLLRHLIITTGMPERYVDLDASEICAVMQKPVDPAALSRCLVRCAELS